VEQFLTSVISISNSATAEQLITVIIHIPTQLLKNNPNFSHIRPVKQTKLITYPPVHLFCRTPPCFCIPMPTVATLIPTLATLIPTVVTLIPTVATLIPSLPHLSLP
jgi:hypothetical protein